MVLEGNTLEKSLKLFLDPRPNPQSAHCGILDMRRYASIHWRCSQTCTRYKKPGKPARGSSPSVAIHITLQNSNTKHGGSNMLWEIILAASPMTRKWFSLGTNIREKIRGVRESIWLSKKDPHKMQDNWKQLTKMNLKSPHSKSSALY